MSDLLQNPVYHALRTGDRHLDVGKNGVHFFDEEVSPFAGFDENNTAGFKLLYEMLRPERHILYATPKHIETPKGWHLVQMAKGLQMVFEGSLPTAMASIFPVPLEKKDTDQMMALTALTRPGPFNRNTIAFGHYHGIFEDKQLVAMTGQRLHVGAFTEISAVCTHPDHLGKGYAFSLVQHQLALVLEQGKTPFLHVRQDNTRAVLLYERLGFRVSRNMNFYFMKSGKGKTTTLH